MRQTLLLSAVLEILKEQAKPLSVPGLQECLQARDLTPNKTSLYRLLEKLQAEDQIEPVLLEANVAHYELKTEHHHHHFKCNDCDEIQCITDPALEERIHALEDKLKQSGLTVKQHQFSISGSCNSCQ